MSEKKVLGMPIVTSEALPPDTILMVPQLDRLPFETQEAYLKRLAKASAVIRFKPKEVPPK